MSASRTFEVQISVLCKHWNDEKLRRQWLKDEFTVRKATANKSMRITWKDDTNVEVYFCSKGASTSQVAVQHSKLARLALVERTRSQWKAALERLSRVL